MSFSSQCYKDLGQKNNALKCCDSALSILSVTNEVGVESKNLFSWDCWLVFGTHYCTVTNNIMFHFFPVNAEVSFFLCSGLAHYSCLHQQHWKEMVCGAVSDSSVSERLSAFELHSL